ncbi:cytochrome c-type biogenesis protein CcmH [Roseibium hamelinense]|uniref:Cytochrome c-type biogenesis protein n=1 Tax=Roseibium hamelinense TaxID=150831 RepID=A0A562T7Y8_9HYPH|nr:cytochrome c-type biogenesis protein [Roseibium hamelinense]MTI43720.1 cytochrome c-type biogenesis protein CcmH [Roseibium hamelinense]TWI89403.1 cytochrome c-type biogenesis protein CcmH [Roseibium hamelinense]
MTRFLASFWIAFTLSLAPAFSITPDEILDDPVLEQRARDLSANLRCMVCQNQSIDDSDAPLAKDLRVLVRERLVDGDSDDEVIDYLVSRYGEFVLLKPRMAPHTFFLWASAPLALVLGLIAIFVTLRRRKPSERDAIGGTVALSEDEKAKLDALLNKKAGS